MKVPRIAFEHGLIRRVLGTGPPWQRTLSAAFALLSAVAFAATLYVACMTQQEAQSLAATGERLRAIQGRPAATPRRPELSNESLKQLDAVVAQLNVPWSEVLDAVERNSDREVGLLALEPDAVAGSVAMTAEARTVEALFAYADALGRDPAFSAVRMAQHDVLEQEAGRPARMMLAVHLARR